MARLVIHVDIDLDPETHDPEEVAEMVMDWDYVPSALVRFASWDD